VSEKPDGILKDKLVKAVQDKIDRIEKDLMTIK